MKKLVLYNYFRSSASFRVRIALHYKNLDFDYRAVHLVKDGGEQNQPEYRKLNPMGEVPCLIHEDRAIAQSMAILQYMDKLWPQNPIFSLDPFDNARIVQLCENINASIQPLQNLRVLQHLGTQFSATQEQKNTWAKFWIEEGFRGFEKLLSTTAGKYCYGNQITAADLFLIPQCVTAQRFNVNLEGFKKINQIFLECMHVPAFAKSHPLRQPDTPAEERLKD